MESASQSMCERWGVRRGEIVRQSSESLGVSRLSTPPLSTRESMLELYHVGNQGTAVTIVARKRERKKLRQSLKLLMGFLECEFESCIIHNLVMSMNPNNWGFKLILYKIENSRSKINH